MPFRRIRGRHSASGTAPAPGQFITDPAGHKDPLDDMKKRLEDEESDAVQSMKSDFISYFLSILRSVMEILSMIVLYAIATLKREAIRPAAITDSAAAAAEDTATEIGPGDGGADTNDTGGSATASSSDKSTRRRYKKVMTVTSIVDTFNSHYSESNVHESSDADELLKLIESKSKSSFPSPTADLIKSVTEKKKTVRTDVDIQSMLYGN